MRPHDDARRTPIAPRQRHHKIADRIHGSFESERCGGGTHEVVRSLLAVAVTVAIDAAPAARGAVESIEKGGCQLNIGLHALKRVRVPVW